jgi:hypothetical protein
VNHTWWYLARSSGLVAWALLAMAVMWGLFMATRLFGRTPSPKWFTDLHRFLGGAAVVFTGIHVGTLVADSYVDFGLRDVLVPMASSWRPAPVAWGVISLWLLAAIEISSLLMRRLPRRLWRVVHMSSFVLFFTATFHALTAGTDARAPIFVMLCNATIAVVLLVTLVRLAAAHSPAARSTRAAPSTRGLAELGSEVVSGPGDPRADGSHGNTAGGRSLRV